jgi:hypothetical protein
VRSTRSSCRSPKKWGDPWNGAIALNNLGDIALYDGQWAEVIELCGRERELRLRLDDRWGAAWALLKVAQAQLALRCLLGDAGRSIRYGTPGKSRHRLHDGGRAARSMSPPCWPLRRGSGRGGRAARGLDAPRRRAWDATGRLRGRPATARRARDHVRRSATPLYTAGAAGARTRISREERDRALPSPSSTR